MDLLDFNVPLTSRGYEVAARDPSVTTYRRRGSRVVDLVADGRLAAPPERVLAVLSDYGHHQQFVKGVAESRVLWKGNAQLIVYQRLGLPLISDRDYTLAVSWGRRGALLFLRFDCANQRGPGHRPGIIRLYTHSGGWLLQPVAGGTLARYQVVLDLAGSLPSWMARSGTSREIPALFASIVKQARG